MRSILQLLEDTKSEEASISERAERELTAIAAQSANDFHPPEVLSALVKLVDYAPRWETRQTAITLVEQVAPQTIVAMLTEGLTSQDVQLRRDAAARLAQITLNLWPETARAIKKQAVSALFAVATGTDRFLRVEAIATLGRLKIKAAVPIFIKALEDDEELVRGDACIALANLGRHAAPAVSALTAALDDGANNSYAAQALGKIGAAAKTAIPDLERVARDAEEAGDDELPEEAAAAIKRISMLDKRRARRAAKQARG